MNATPLIYAIRHGQTDWNVEGRFQGTKDVPINETGRRQADRNGLALKTLLGDRAASFDFVSSPLGRSRETMQRIRSAIGLPAEEYRIDDRLIEVSFGDWEGHTLKEIAACNDSWRRRIDDRGRDKWNFQPPGDNAESYEILTWRVAAWLKSVNRPTICVSHGGIVRCLFHLVGGMPGSEAAELTPHQHRILEVDGRSIRWVPDFDSSAQTA